jgi:hypothetical protein
MPAGGYVEQMKQAIKNHATQGSMTPGSHTKYVLLIRTILGWAEPVTGVVVLPFLTPEETK